MSEIRRLLGAISEETRRVGVDIEANLNSGASEDQISEAIRRLPFSLSDDVLELFRWHNGARERRICEIRIIPRFVFDSLSESVDSTLQLSALADDPEMQWRRSWFRLWEDLAGDCYAVETQPGSTFGRIWAIRFGEVYEAFWSLEAMLACILECWRARAYYIDEEGTLQEKRELSDPIYRRISSGLSPHRLDLSDEKERFITELPQVIHKLQREGRFDLIEKLRDLAMEAYRIDIDDF